MIKYILLIITFFAFTPFSFSQNIADSNKATLTGTVYTEENIKLSNILITISGQSDKYNTFSDNSGTYEIEIIPG